MMSDIDGGDDGLLMMVDDNGNGDSSSRINSAFPCQVKMFIISTKRRPSMFHLTSCSTQELKA